MLPLIKAVPVISTLVELGMTFYDWYTGKTPPVEEPVAPNEIKARYDTHKLLPWQEEVVISTFNQDGTLTQQAKADYLNSQFGMNKSVTVYRRIWKASIKD